MLGLTGELLTLFDRVALFLCLPSVTYGAMPFYRSALGGLRARRFSIDVPVTIGILLGYFISSYHVLTGGGDVYFDTVAMLVFLLLASRYLLEAAREKGMEASEVKNFFSNSSARRIEADGTIKEVHSSLLQKGEKVEIQAGETVPADSLITQGASYFNESVLTGESFPVKKSEGELIFGGSENQGAKVLAEVCASSGDSKMGKILSRLQENWGKQTEIARLSDRFSKILVVSVSVIATALYFYFWAIGDPGRTLKGACYRHYHLPLRPWI